MAEIYANIRRDEYELLHDAYYGTGMFADGTAIQKHPRESEQSISYRRKMAYYLNYVGPIVNASVDPVFKDEINRDYGNSMMFDEFIQNVDRHGTTLQEFVRQNATLAKLYGVMYVVVDNVNEFGESLSTALTNRSMPFLTAVEPKQVVNWEFDERGALVKFAYATYIHNANGTAQTRLHIWTPSTWRIEEQGGKLIGEGTHNIGRIPVVQWFGRAAKKTDILPPPECLSIAETNRHIYNLCSSLSQILFNQTFSVLTMPVNQNGLKDITIGTDNLLAYPIESGKAPQFIAPDKGPAEVHMTQIDNLIDEMYRMSGIDSVIGVQQAKSGVAKQWDFERTNQRLADFSVQCEEAELDIIDLYKAWSGDHINYTCEYPRDFKVNDITESLTQAQQAKDLNIESDIFVEEVVKKVIDSYMPNIDIAVRDAIINEVKESAKKREQDDAFYDIDINSPIGVDNEHARDD